MFTEKFWRWVHGLAERKLRDFVRHTRRCPNCNTWTHVKPLIDYNRLDDVYDTMTCGQCGYTSKWDMISSMLPICTESNILDKVTPLKKSQVPPPRW